jgi:TolA-binding protein
MDPETDLQFELDLIRRRFTRLWVAAVVLALAGVASLAWSLGLSRSTQRLRGQIGTVHAVVDSLQRVASTDVARINPLEERLTTLDELRQELRTKADRSTMNAIQSRLDEISARLARGDSLVAELRGDLARQASDITTASNDSLAALRRDFSARMTGIHEANLKQQSRLEALDARIGAVADATRRSGKGRALLTGITVLDAGVLAAYLAGHAGS